MTQAAADEDKLKVLARAIGHAIGKMHDIEIVHGDLTTSNLMVQDPVGGDGQTWAPQVVIIDFGLGMTKPLIEDKAVDLYVLERAFLSTHPGSAHLVGVWWLYAMTISLPPLPIIANML